MTGLLAFSDRGCALGERIAAHLAQNGEPAELTRCPNGGLAAWTAAHFACDALIFIGSCGIAVRAVAPFAASKISDPAVVVIDERARFAISLLSGHVGGANDLARRLAAYLGAQPVVTTATDAGGVFAFDGWAARQGLGIANAERIKPISARLLSGGTVALQSDFPLAGAIPCGVVLHGEAGDVVISIYGRRQGCAGQDALWLIPPAVTLGIGCRRGISCGAIEDAFSQILANTGCHPLAVGRVCSIDIKAEEPGILAFCHGRSLPYQTFSARELEAVTGNFSASGFVKRTTGTDNVCERSAVLGCGGRLIAKKLAKNGVALALGLGPYTVNFEEKING